MSARIGLCGLRAVSFAGSMIVMGAGGRFCTSSRPGKQASFFFFRFQSVPQGAVQLDYCPMGHADTVIPRTKA